MSACGLLLSWFESMQDSEWSGSYPAGVNMQKSRSLSSCCLHAFLWSLQLVLLLVLKWLSNRPLLSTEELLTTDLFSSPWQAQRRATLHTKEPWDKNVNKKTWGYHYIQINSLLSCSCSVFWLRIQSLLIALLLSLMLPSNQVASI